MKKKIYIVDDDPEIVASLTTVLSTHGYEVKAQNDEADLDRNLQGFEPALIILDVMFPEDSSAGFRIARRLKDDPSLRRIPILMLSAVNEKGIYVGKFSNRDLDDSYLPVQTFLDKPVKPAKLIEKVASLIGAP